MGSSPGVLGAGEAVSLARLCADIGAGAGRRCVALVTAMDEPLGRRIGNALEHLKECDVQIVDVAAAAAQQAQVLDTRYRGADRTRDEGLFGSAVQGKKILPSCYSRSALQRHDFARRRISMLFDQERASRIMSQQGIDALVTAVQEMGRLVEVPTPTIDVVLALVQQRAQVAGTYAYPKGGEER